MSAKKQRASPYSRPNQALKQLTLNFSASPKSNTPSSSTSSESKCRSSSNLLLKDEFAKQCKTCLMYYNPHDRQDVHLHAKYHNDFTNVSFLKYSASSKKRNNEKIVQSYPDGKCVVIESGVDSKQSIVKALKILDYVDKQLGINDSSSRSKMPDSIITASKSQESKPRNQQSYKFYLFVTIDNKIAGFCLAEEIEKAFEIVYLNKNDTTNGSFSYDESKPHKASCGISRIWVSDSMRRKNVASRLLDCVCQNFLFIRFLDKNELAFSDPTQNGQCLARKYCEKENFLVYNSSTCEQIRKIVEEQNDISTSKSFINEFDDSD